MQNNKKFKRVILVTLITTIVYKIMNYHRYKNIINYITDISNSRNTKKFKNAEEYILYILKIQHEAFKESKHANINKIKAIEPLKQMGLNLKAIVFILNPLIFKKLTYNINNTTEIRLIIKTINNLSAKQYLKYITGIDNFNTKETLKINSNNKDTNKDNNKTWQNRKYTTLK